MRVKLIRVAVMVLVGLVLGLVLTLLQGTYTPRALSDMLVYVSFAIIIIGGAIILSNQGAVVADRMSRLPDQKNPDAPRPNWLQTLLDAQSLGLLVLIAGVVLFVVAILTDVVTR
jgi:hypothetical protein